MIRHRHLHTHTHTRAHVHVHTHTMIHTTCTHTHTHTHIHNPPHTHTHRADEKVAAAVGSPVSLMLCSPPPPPPMAMVFISESQVKAAWTRCVFRLDLRRRESGLYRNRVPHTGAHTGHPILKRRCISTFQVNMCDRELFVRRRSKGSAGSVKTETM